MEDQWIQKNMKGLALESLGGPLTQVQYSPGVLHKQNLQMNHRYSPIVCVERRQN